MTGCWPPLISPGTVLRGYNDPPGVTRVDGGQQGSAGSPGVSEGSHVAECKTTVLSQTETFAQGRVQEGFCGVALAWGGGTVGEAYLERFRERFREIVGEIR